MKKPIGILLGLFFVFSLEAQVLDRIFVELSLGRYAKETGLLDPEYYSNEISYVNGFNIGYKLSPKWRFHMGIRKLHSSINTGKGETGELSESKGAEFKLGAKYSPGSHKRIFISYGLELVGESSKLNGFFWLDHSPGFYDINHSKVFIGMAPNIAANLNVSEHIIFFAETSLRFGQVNTKQIKRNSYSDNDLYQEDKFNTAVYEPLSTVGLRFEL